MGSSDSISNQTIIQSMLRNLKGKGFEGFTARPWNYFKPESTLWWLIPSTEWPAYKYGKLVFFRAKECYRVGVHIERGISENAGQMLSSKNALKLCTKPDWAWNSLLSDLSNGKFENRLKEISKITDRPLRVSLQASIITSEYDPYSEKIEGLETDHIISFEYSSGELKVLEDEMKGEMRKYGYIAKIDDLMDVFQEKDLGWLWIDMFITVDVEISDEAYINELTIDFVKNYSEMFGFTQEQ